MGLPDVNGFAVSMGLCVSRCEPVLFACTLLALVFESLIFLPIRIFHVWSRGYKQEQTRSGEIINQSRPRTPSQASSLVRAGNTVLFVRFFVGRVCAVIFCPIGGEQIAEDDLTTSRPTQSCLLGLGVGVAHSTRHRA